MPWDRRRVDPHGSYTVVRPFRYGGRDMKVGAVFPVHADRLRADQLLRRGQIAPAGPIAAPVEATEEVAAIFEAAAALEPHETDPSTTQAHGLGDEPELIKPRRRRRRNPHAA